MTRISYRPISGSLEQVLRLVLLGLGSAIVYATALLRFPLVGIYNYPLQNLDKLTLSDRATGIVLAGSVLLLFASYATGALLLDRAIALGPRGGRRLAPVVLGFPVLFIILLLLVYPTTSVDLYDYLFRGRMLARYNANTFLLVPRDFRTDPLFPYVAWKGAVTAYGPVWEGMSWLVARLAGEALLDELKEKKIDLAVLGYHHKRTLGEMLLGTTHDYLARHAPCHLLMSIPPRG